MHASSSKSVPNLQNRTIMVTRPAHQADNFCALLARSGAMAIRCPAMQITDPADTSSLTALIDQLDAYDFLMFNSPNAASRGIAFIHKHRRIPDHVTIGAIGTKTANVVRARGYDVQVSPAADFDSESFLRIADVWDMCNKRVAILRGQTGRLLLGETLRRRGALVDFVTTYQRLPPSPEQAETIRQGLRRSPDAITITSSETMTNLAACLDGQDFQRLVESLLIVGHPRIRATAERLGLNNTFTAADPSDESMFAAIVSQFAS